MTTGPDASAHRLRSSPSHLAKSSNWEEKTKPLRVSEEVTMASKFGLPAKPDLTPRQEAFARLVSTGHNLSDAYRATYSSQGKASTVNVSASKLAKTPKIYNRIEMLLKEQEATMHRDAVAIRRHVFAGLMKESRNEMARPSERISALIALGKIDVVSMFREVRSIEDRTERKPEEVETELRSKLRELFKGETIEHNATEVSRPVKSNGDSEAVE